MQKSECVLATIPGAHARARLLVVSAHTRAGESQVVLRQQSWAEGIGWYDQQSLGLAPHQLRQLKAVLGCHSSPARRDDSGAPVVLAFPGVVCTESA
jgi:hypothetical protein